MRGIVVLICSLFVLITVSAQSEKFVELNGKGFRLDGVPFYPVTMNYSIIIVRDQLGNEFVGPSHSYGLTGGMEITNGANDVSAQDCYSQIVEDLVEIKSMGFNSIRCGVAYAYDLDPANFGIGPCYTSYDMNFVKELKPVQAPYSKMKEFLGSILSAAAEADLKVQLLIGGHKVDDPNTAIQNGFLSYLEAISAHFEGNSTLYSYDFFNEPSYSSSVNHTKSMACSLVSSWNQAIKDNTVHHYTTVGLGNWGETFRWDPRFLELDFLSFHIYPHISASGGSIQVAVEKVKNDIKWIAETSKRPWILGEIGFRAVDENGGYNHTPVPQTVTYVDGTLQDQKDFIRTTLKYVRDCGGAGYSWWQYQDFSFGTHDNYNGDYFGLKDHNGALKPGVAEFQSFDPFINEGTGIKASSYYNYDNQSGYSLSGKILNMDSEPIANAIINSQNGAFTFSKSDGTYVLNSNNPLDTVYFTATGCNSFSENFGGFSWGGIDRHLEQFSPIEDMLIGNATISNGQYANYEAASSIEILGNFVVQGNGSSGGVVSMQASNSIKLSSSFSAQKGSIFKARLEEVFWNCASGSYNIDQPNSNNYEEAYIVERKERANDIEVFPNPTDGIFHVKMRSYEEPIERIEVINDLGSTIISRNVGDFTGKIDLSKFSSGIYTLRCHTRSGAYVRKIVKN